MPDFFGDHSEDTQKEILEHTVGQGKDFYAAALAHPERAPIGEHINAPAFRGAALVGVPRAIQQDIPEDQ